MSSAAAFERLYDWRWWISVPLVVVSVLAGSALQPAAWIVGFLLILAVWIPGAFLLTRAARRAGRSARHGVDES
jgi:hypothetical protein